MVCTICIICHLNYLRAWPDFSKIKMLSHGHRKTAAFLPWTTEQPEDNNLRDQWPHLQLWPTGLPLANPFLGNSLTHVPSTHFPHPPQYCFASLPPGPKLLKAGREENLSVKLWSASLSFTQCVLKIIRLFLEASAGNFTVSGDIWDCPEGRDIYKTSTILKRNTWEKVPWLGLLLTQVYSVL